MGDKVLMGQLRLQITSTLMLHALVSPPESLPPPFPLKQVKVPIVENGICDSKYHTGLYTEDNVRIVRDDMMCAGNTKKDSCQVSLCPPQSPTCTGLKNGY